MILSYFLLIFLVSVYILCIISPNEDFNMESTFKKLKKTFLNFSISKKMLLGYLPLSALTILMAFYTLSSLYRLNVINESIVKTDIRLIDTTDKMVEHLLAQERYGRRFIILNSLEMKKLFHGRSKDFKNDLITLESLSDMVGLSADPLASLHEEYDSLFTVSFN